MQTERIGSSKKMIASGETGLLFQEDLGFTSIFDRGVIPDFQSDELARARTMQTACAFAWLEQNGFRTHWHKRKWSPSGKGLIVQEAKVGDKPLLSGETSLDVIGLEMLFRVRASKKFCGRVARGEVDLPIDVWQSSTPPQRNELLSRPFVEASTKWEAVDRYLTPEEALNYVDLPIHSLHYLYRWVSQMAGYLNEFYWHAGATLIDGKVEVARCRQTDDFVLIDGISLDELGVRFDYQEFGKNPVRDWYKSNHPDWYAALQQAQEDYPDDPSKWPDYPAIDEKLAAEHVKRYRQMSSLLDGTLRTVF